MSVNIVTASGILPVDDGQAVLVGRVWDAETQGPRPVRIVGEQV